MGGGDAPSEMTEWLVDGTKYNHADIEAHQKVEHQYDDIRGKYEWMNADYLSKYPGWSERKVHFPPSYSFISKKEERGAGMKSFYEEGWVPVKKGDVQSLIANYESNR